MKLLLAAILSLTSESRYFAIPFFARFDVLT